jgi:uncharacterized membrane protein
MSSWLILAVVAQFIAAVVAFFDKYIVTSKDMLPRPFVYAYVTCLLSGASIVVYGLSWIQVPLDGVHFPSISNVEFPTLTVIAFSFLAAYSFFGGLISLFSAFRAADASDVVPVVGSISALCTFGLGYAFLDAPLSRNFIIGIALLSCGTLLVSHLRFTWQTALLTIHAGLFFAIHYVTFKGLLAVTSFDNAFFWSRIGLVAFALSLLLVPEYLEKVRSQVQSTGRRGGALVGANKILAGAASILVLKATELAPNPAVIQALGGLQFVFLLGIGIFLGHRTPTECGENNCARHPDILHKTVAVGIITLGFFVLFV